jgi:signal transduction histidine kinase
MKKKSTTLTGFLFKTGGIGLGLSFASYSGLSCYFALKMAGDLALDRTRLSQQLFTANITNDLLSGLDANVYGKCQSLFKDKSVLGIHVVAFQRNVCSLSKDGWAGGQAVDTAVYFDSKNKNQAAAITVFYDKSYLHHFLLKFLIFSIATLALSTAFLMMLAIRLNRSLTKPIATMADRFKSELPILSEDEKQELSKSGIIEINDILSSFIGAYERIENYQQQTLRDITSRNIAAMAQQVAHDIRSPLAALSSAEQSLDIVPEDTRTLIRSAVTRIKDIANNLLNIDRPLLVNASLQGNTTYLNTTLQTGRLSVRDDSETDSQHIFWLIESIVSEKRMQFRMRKGLTIESKFDENNEGIFSAVSPIEFQRMISNLIDNSIEASDVDGKIVVDLSGDEKWIYVRVSDNGRGIPKDALPRLMNRGVTLGKPGGSGLGLFHAKTLCESVNGFLTVDSILEKGTTVTVKLCRSKAPKWHTNEIMVRKSSTIVILDDDSSIHNIWRKRFADLSIEKYQIKELYFYRPEEFREWFRENSFNAAIFLLDLQYHGHPESGLDLIEELNISDRSLLVTSQFDDVNVRCRCRALRVSLVAKTFVPYIPVKILDEV